MVLWFPNKLNIELPYDSAFPLLSIYPKELKTDVQTETCTDVLNNIIHNHQNVEITQISINWWMDKQNAVYLYNEIIFHHKKEWSTDTCYEMNDLCKHTLNERSQAQKTSYHMLLLKYIVGKKYIQNKKIDRNRKQIIGYWGLGKRGEWEMAA